LPPLFIPENSLWYLFPVVIFRKAHLCSSSMVHPFRSLPPRFISPRFSFVDAIVSPPKLVPKGLQRPFFPDCNSDDLSIRSSPVPDLVGSFPPSLPDDDFSFSPLKVSASVSCCTVNGKLVSRNSSPPFFPILFDDFFFSPPGKLSFLPSLPHSPRSLSHCRPFTSSLTVFALAAPPSSFPANFDKSPGLFPAPRPSFLIRNPDPRAMNVDSRQFFLPQVDELFTWFRRPFSFPVSPVCPLAIPFLLSGRHYVLRSVCLRFVLLTLRSLSLFCGIFNLRLCQLCDHGLNAVPSSLQI